MSHLKVKVTSRSKWKTTSFKLYVANTVKQAGGLHLTEMHSCINYNNYFIITARKQSLVKGNVFTRVCNSVHGGCIPAYNGTGGVYRRMQWGRQCGGVYPRMQWGRQTGVVCQSDPPWYLGTSPDIRGRGLHISRASLKTWALRQCSPFPLLSLPLNASFCNCLCE